MRKYVIECVGLFFLSACSGQPKGITLDVQETKPEEMISPVVDQQIVQEDTTIYTMEHPTTAYLEDFAEYFQQNNRYANWDKANERRTIIQCVVEKDGRATQVRVARDSGEDRLDAEAVRLIEEAVYVPMKTAGGQPVRSLFTIPVYFPPR